MEVVFEDGKLLKDYTLTKQKPTNMSTQYEVESQKIRKSIISWSVIGLIIVIVVAVICMIGCPTYSVYTAKKEGEAVLAHAQSSREVQVAEAKAKMEASSLLAQADTVRAHGVARSNAIIGESLKNNEAYLHWLWIDNIEKNPQAVIYVPTEANMPILEAGHRDSYNKQTKSFENK